MNKICASVIWTISLLLTQIVTAETAVFEDFSDSLSFQKFDRVETKTELDDTNNKLDLAAKGRSFTYSGPRNNIFLINSGNTTKFQADISISESNLGSTETQAAFIRMGGVFYETQLGRVFTVICLGNRGNGLEAWYEIQENIDQPIDANGNNPTLNLTQGKLNLNSLSLNTSYTVSITYNNDKGFTFIFNNEPPISVDGPVKTENRFAWKLVGTKLRFSRNNNTPNNLDDSSPDNGSSASIIGSVDNVTTDIGISDDFSNGNLNKWDQGESTRFISNAGQLKMIATQQDSGRTTERLNIRQQGIKFLGAKVTLLSDSVTNESTRMRGRITDYLGNDTFDVSNGDTPDGEVGNIWTQLVIERLGDGSFRAFAYASRVTAPDFSTETQLFFEILTPSNPIAYDQQYALAIEQNGTVVNYKIDGETLYSFDLATQPLLSGNVFTEVDNPSFPIRSGISARVQSGPGEAHVLFDDIVTDITPSTINLNANNGDGEKIILPDEVIVNVGELVNLLVDVDNPDEVLAYIWEQLSGTVITNQTSTANRALLSKTLLRDTLSLDNKLSFIVPDGTDTETLSFRVTVVNKSGVEATKDFSVNVDNSKTATLAATPVVTPPVVTPPVNSGGGGSINPFMLFWIVILGAVRIRFSRS